MKGELLNSDGTLQFANASKLTDHLWIGGDLETLDPTLADSQLDELVEAGVTDIIDVRLERNDAELVAGRHPDLGYLWLGVDDAGQLMPDEWFEQGTQYALQRLSDGGTVLAHCHMGVNRGPSMGFAVMLALGWNAINALEFIHRRRPEAYIGYAEDALDWWLRKNQAGQPERSRGQEQIAQWRRKNFADITEVARAVR